MPPQVRIAAALKMSDKKEKWTKDSQFTREQLEVSRHWCPLTERKPKPKLSGSTPSPRVLDVLNVAECVRLKRGLGKEDFYCNFTQSVLRAPWGAMRCLCTSTFVYDFERDRVLCPLEHLALQGLPTRHIAEKLASIGEDYTDREFAKLSGQGFFIPSIGSVLMAFFLNFDSPWWSPHNKRARLA
jgi:hypothetical protein